MWKGALLQLSSTDKPKENLEVINNMINLAASKNIDFIALPETANCISNSRSQQNKVLETEEKLCEGPSVVIDHGKSTSGERLIAIYTHTGDFLVKEGDIVKRGMPVAKLPEKISFPCMARVRHLHLQIGQQYCEKEEKHKWGCDFFIKDKYSSLNPHLFWANGKNKVTCYDKNRKYLKGTITYPFFCKKI